MGKAIGLKREPSGGGGRKVAAVMMLLGIVAAVAITLVWKLTPLTDLVTPERLADSLRSVQEQPAAPLIFIALYVLGGLVMAPVLALIVAVAILFPPLAAVSISLSGVLLSASMLYWVGARFGMRIQPKLGPAVGRVRDFIDDRGVISIALIRMLPIAPFSIVNLAAGSLGVQFRQYIAGTALGMLPGILAISFFGQQVRSTLSSPTPTRILVAVLAIVLWFALCAGLQRLLKRRRPTIG